MDYTETLLSILICLTAYSLLFLSRNTYVNAFIVVLSGGVLCWLLIVFVVFFIVVFFFALFLSFFAAVLFNKDIFDVLNFLVGQMVDDLRNLVTTVFVYLIVATPFLIALRRRPDLTKRILWAAGGALLACVLISGASYGWQWFDYARDARNVTATAIPQRPENIALKRTVRVQQADIWHTGQFSDPFREARCEALCESLLDEAGVRFVRMTTLREDQFGASSRSSVIYRRGRNQECIQPDIADIDAAFRSGQEIVRDVRSHGPVTSQCVLAHRENATDTGFVEIALTPEPGLYSRMVERVEIADLTTPSGTVLLRSTEKTIYPIVFPLMLARNGAELRRWDVYCGKFRKGDFDNVFRQVLIVALGYRLAGSGE